MAISAQVHGAPVKLRRPAGVFFLTLITLGVYGAVWYYRANRELRDYGRAYQHAPLAGTKPAVSLLAVTLGLLVVVPAIISVSRFVGRVREAERIGGTRLTSGWLVLALAVVGLFILLPGLAILSYLQSDLNALWRRYVGEPERVRDRWWDRAAAWIVRGEARPVRPPPGWVVSPLTAWAYLLASAALIAIAAALDSEAAAVGFLGLDLAYGVQVYEDCRAHGDSRFWWPAAVTSYGPLVAVAYAYNRRESEANRGGAEPPPSPQEWGQARVAVAAAPAAWYPDPLGHARLRYWDGERWTQHVAP